MDFQLNTEQKELLAQIGTFGEKEILPYVTEWDEKESFPPHLVDGCKKLGLFGMLVPKEYGGLGFDTLTFCLAIEEMSKYSASVGVMLAVHNSVCVYPITLAGSPYILEKYLPKLATGEWIGAFGLTEAGAGSDAANIATKADLIEGADKNKFSVNGSKVFITNGKLCHVAVMLAKTKPELRAKGATCFVVDKSMEGFAVGKKEEKLGMRMSDTTELVFTNMEVEEDQILGELDQGFSVMMNTLNSSRIGIGAQAVGIASAALEACVEFTKNTKEEGKPLFAKQNVANAIAEMKAELDAARLLVYRACSLKDGGHTFIAEGAMAKLMASKAAVAITGRVMQIFGLAGLKADSHVERYYRDAKITEIYEGTSEVQKMVIAKNITI